MKDSKDLASFVLAARAHGATDEFLVALLRDRGWPSKQIYSVLARHYEEVIGLQVPDPPGRLEAARETFFHLLAFGALATSVFSIGSIWFDLIGYWFPDPTLSNADRWIADRLLRNLASIMVVIPVFVWATRAILADQADNPDKAESAVRRWIGNIGLLLTAAVFIGDLVAFVTSLLQGELTVRFVLDCVVVLALAGGVFLYYGKGLGKLRALPTLAWHRAFAWFGTASAIATLALGFWVAGSPAGNRAIGEDRRRVNDLYHLAVQLQNKRYSGAIQRPPTQLSDLGLSAPDPFTGRPFEYHRLDGERYQVCAVFNVPSPPSTATESFWRHPAGRSCFELSLGVDTPPPPFP